MNQFNSCLKSSNAKLLDIFYACAHTHIYHLTCVQRLCDILNIKKGENEYVFSVYSVPRHQVLVSMAALRNTIYSLLPILQIKNPGM